MPSESIPSAGSPGTRGEVPAWSEDPLTARARSVWTGGDFLPIARSFAPGAQEFIARLALRPGESVLDVACGTGNLATPAARAGARVTGIDIAANLIAQARLEARTAGCVIAFEVGDAEALPYMEHQFDTTVTMFGAMFAYRPERAATELLRVTRPGGRVAVLEFSKPRHWLFGRLYQFYFRRLLPLIGQAISRSKDNAYLYLPASVLEFPDGEALAERLRRHGLKNVHWYPLTFGIATLYVGTKA